MCLALADGRPAHLTRVRQRADQPARKRPAPARRHHGLEERPAPADLPAGRVHLRPGRGRARQGRARRAAIRRRSPAVCDNLLEATIPEEFKDASRLAGRGLDGHGDLLPAPARQRRGLRRPRSLLGPPQEQPAAQRKRAVLRLLPLGMCHDARRERPGCPRTRPPHDPVVLPPRPRPCPGPGPDPDAGRRYPARRHPRRLWLRSPRRRSLGHPAARRRRAGSSRTSTRTTAAPRAPTKAPSSATETCTAPRRRARCRNSGRSPAAPPPKTPPRTTPAPLNWPATSSAASPGTTPTATTAPPAPPPRARSAALSAPRR